MLITHLEQRGKVGRNLLLTPTHGFVYLLHLTEWLFPPAQLLRLPLQLKRGGVWQEQPASSHPMVVLLAAIYSTSLQNTAVAIELGPCYPCSSFIESQNGRVLKDHPAPTPAVGLLPSYQVRPPNAALEMAGDWVLGLGGTSSFRI